MQTFVIILKTGTKILESSKYLGVFLFKKKNDNVKWGPT